MARRTVVLLASLLAVPALQAQPAAPAAVAPPAPSWVRDEAGVMSDAGRARAAALADEAWRVGQVRLAVTIVRDTGASSIADAARAAWRAQELSGRAVLLLVAVDRRENHIEVGDAVAHDFPVAFRRRVLEDVFAPAARAQGVEPATLRALEALHGRAVRPASAAQQIGAAWGWLGRYGVFVFVGALAASARVRAFRAGRRDLRRRAEEFDALVRSYRALRARFARAEGDGGAYRDAPRGEAAPAAEAEVKALEARVARARDGSGRTGSRLAEVSACVDALRAHLDPLEARANVGARFLALREALPGALRGLHDALTDAKGFVKRGARVWPGESFDAAERARAKAEVEAAALAREVPEVIARGEGLAEDALLPVCEALDALEVRLRAAVSDAGEPRERFEAMQAAAKDIESLRTELSFKASEVIAASRPGVPPESVERYRACLDDAMSLQDKEMVPFAASLRALRRARLGLLGEQPRSQEGSSWSPFPSDEERRSAGGGGSAGGSSGTSGGW